MPGFRDYLLNAYLENPCQVLPNPLWKTLDRLAQFQTAFGAADGFANRLEAVSGDSLYIYWRRSERQSSQLIRRKLESMQLALIHQDFLDADTVAGFLTRQPYFRLLHNHQTITSLPLPPGITFAPITPETDAPAVRDFLGEGIERVDAWREHRTFAPDLWLWAVDDGVPVGFAAGEFDPDVREASIEWVQVAPSCQGRGIGAALVSELLRRAAERASFTTVSGPMEFKDRENPGGYFRRFGFSGQDVWWLLGRV